jgi:hypothetical protein
VDELEKDYAEHSSALIEMKVEPLLDPLPSNRDSRRWSQRCVCERTAALFPFPQDGLESLPAGPATAP